MSPSDTRLLKKPPVKRRKLPMTGPSAVELCALSLGQENRSSERRDLKVQNCVSCHRALFAWLAPTVLCERCNAAMCAICSRTCDAKIPNRRSTSSPLPDGMVSVTSTLFPRRGALSSSLNSIDMKVKALNGTSDESPVSGNGRRRRCRDDEETCENATDEENRAWEDILPGCGRTICQDCCFESPMNGTTTCHDCKANK